MIDGVEQLKTGSKELNDGMIKFNEDGIAVISETVNDKLLNLTDNFKAVRDVSKEYNTFSGISDEMNGSVKFIYMFDEISE
ncbi:MAG: hypothetical protein IJZ64_04300 [Ruminococcus sp.]|nr:hypothetical protein [Ruminococcus sp.]